MVGVQQWAEIRRMVLVERRSQREVARVSGLARDTVARAVRSEVPPRYVRGPASSKVDPVRDWICEQLRPDPRIPSQRLREMAVELGYEGGKTIFDDFVREIERGGVALDPHDDCGGDESLGIVEDEVGVGGQSAGGDFEQRRARWRPAHGADGTISTGLGSAAPSGGELPPVRWARRDR